MKVTIDEPTLPILSRLALRQAKQRLLCTLLRRPSLWPYVEPSGINRRHFCNNRKWQEAFDVVRGGADIPALVAADPTSETAHLWDLGFEMDAGAMFSLARQIVLSVRAEEAAAEIAETARRSGAVVHTEDSRQAKATVIDVSVERPATKPELVAAAEVPTARVGAVRPDAQRHGIAAKEPKLVPRTAPRSRTPAGKLAEAMSFLRDELQGEVEAPVIETRARKAGIAIKTLKRARAKLGIVSRRDGFGPRGKFYLSLRWDHSGPTGA
jgi:GNAT superfamily N-acetyltransferase